MNQKVSIITINYNNAYGLKKTIESVISQTYKNIEFIVIDGGSNDTSLEIIKAQQHKIKYWVSEKDKGIYDAMNKGIKVATGEYLFMLNSGDCLLNSDVIEKIFANKRQALILYGNLFWLENDLLTKQVFPNPLSFKYLKSNSIGHQATFIHQSVHQIVGLYNQDYSITGDWVLFMMAMFKHQIKFEYLDSFISICPRDGLSCNPANFEKIKIEKNTLLKNEFGNLIEEFDKLLETEARYEKIVTNKLYRVISYLKLFNIFKV